MVPEGSVLNFFEVPIENKTLINAYKIYKHSTDMTPDEKKTLDDLENFMFKIYDSHRDEMSKK